MSIALIRGEKITADELRLINKGEPIQKVRLDISWDFKPDIEVDWDGSIVLLENDRMMWADDSLVFYNKLESDDGAIKHTGDWYDGLTNLYAEGDEGDEIILIDLRRVSTETHTILAILTLFFYAIQIRVLIYSRKGIHVSIKMRK